MYSLPGLLLLSHLRLRLLLSSCLWLRPGAVSVILLVRSSSQSLLQFRSLRMAAHASDLETQLQA